MELFKITCVTCQAGLSVRNEALLGQIVACPRCGSMVEVAAPTTAGDSTAASAESAAAQGTIDSAPTDSAPTGAPDTASSPPDSATAGSAAVEDSGRCDTASPREAGSAETAALQAASAEAMQVSAAVAKYQWMVWSLASCLIVATVVGAVLLTRGDSSAETATQTPRVINKAVSQLPADAAIGVTDLPSGNESNAALPAIIELPPAEIPGEGIPGGATAKGVKLPATIDRRAVEPPAVDPTTLPEVVIATESPTDSSPNASTDSAPPLARRAPPLPVDPLDWDPASLTLATVDQPFDPSIAAVNSADPEATVAPAESADEVPSTAPLVRRGPSAGPADANHPSARDAADQLALLIPSMKVDQMPLVDCLRLFSQFSGVPVSVAPEQLLMAGITSQEPVSLDASEIGLGEMLTRVLEPLRLEYQTRGAQVVVVRQAAAKVREITYPVDDLLAASASGPELAGWVEQMVAPASWQALGGDGTLEISAGRMRIIQTQQVQYQVLILLERLRLAVGLSPRSRYPVERLAATLAQQLLVEQLAASTTFTFSNYTALDAIFVHWQAELGVPLLIDWPALAEADTWPETTVACAIIDQPWSVALEKVLEPLGLGWRAASGGAIEITTAEKVQNESQLEIYPLRAGAKTIASELAAQIAALWKPPTAPGSLACDATGRVLLVFQPAARQRLVWQHLQQLGLLGEE